MENFTDDELLLSVYADEGSTDREREMARRMDDMIDALAAAQTQTQNQQDQK